jgi:hypothetical protein
MINRFVILLVMVSSVACAADSLELSVLGIASEPVSRKSAKSISVVATNRGSDDPVVFAEISVERKGADGKFSWFRVDTECPCNAKCKKELVALKKLESKKAEWDLLGGLHCEKAEPGIYRFAVVARYSDAISGYIYHGVSKEFTIKE